MPSLWFWLKQKSGKRTHKHSFSLRPSGVDINTQYLKNTTDTLYYLHVTWSWVEKKEFLNQEIIIHNSIKGTRDKPEWTKILITRVYKSKTISRSNFSICYLQSRCVLCYLCVLVFRFHAWRWCITEHSARSISDCPKHCPPPAVLQGVSESVFLAATISLSLSQHNTTPLLPSCQCRTTESPSPRLAASLCSH